MKKQEEQEDSSVPDPIEVKLFSMQFIDRYALFGYTEDGDKYEMVDRGLRINRLEVWDNGTYECRAEVASHGNVKLRHVRLEVLCKNYTLSLPTIMFQLENISLYKRRCGGLCT